MAKRSPARRERAKEWAREKAKTASFWLVLLIFLVLVLSLWVMFGDTIGYDARCIYERLGVTEKAPALKTLGFTIAGIVALLGVVVANRRAKALADSAEATTKSAEAAAKSAKAAADSAEAATDTAEATEAGNRQRAFKDGVEQLGSDKSSVRQGGAHALFHLALRDDELRASIAGVLCAHIRETTSDKAYQKQNEDKPSTEMQSLLRLMFTAETVGKRKLVIFWRGIAPDLEGGYFCGLELGNAWFRGAKLSSAQFQRASLWDAQLQEASLWSTQLDGASLTRAQFQGASLLDAQLQGASLEGAQFQGASLWDAQFQGASLEGAQFQGASLWDAQFQGASLEGAQFQGASLRGVQFHGAWLSGAQFQAAWLSGSQFQGASLYMAGFQQTQFGEGPEEDLLDQDRAVYKSDDPVEKLKVSAFHGVSSEPKPRIFVPFEKRINDRTGKESDFSKVIFSGGVTQEQLAEAKKALGLKSWPSGTFDSKERLIRNLESEIGKPESNTPPKEIVARSYGKKDAERWIQEFQGDI